LISFPKEVVFFISNFGNDDILYNNILLIDSIKVTLSDHIDRSLIQIINYSKLQVLSGCLMHIIFMAIFFELRQVRNIW